MEAVRGQTPDHAMYNMMETLFCEASEDSKRERANAKRMEKLFHAAGEDAEKERARAQTLETRFREVVEDAKKERARATTLQNLLTEALEDRKKELLLSNVNSRSSGLGSVESDSTQHRPGLGQTSTDVGTHGRRLPVSASIQNMSSASGSGLGPQPSVLTLSELKAEAEPGCKRLRFRASGGQIYVSALGTGSVLGSSGFGLRSLLPRPGSEASGLESGSGPSGSESGAGPSGSGLSMAGRSGVADVGTNAIGGSRAGGSGTRQGYGVAATTREGDGGATLCRKMWLLCKEPVEQEYKFGLARH